MSWERVVSHARRGYIVGGGPKGVSGGWGALGCRWIAGGWHGLGDAEERFRFLPKSRPVCGVSGVLGRLRSAESRGVADGTSQSRSGPMKPTSAGEVSRRRFLKGGGTAAVGAVAAIQSVATQAGTSSDANPWRYDVDRLKQVDPKWIGYERVAGFPVGKVGAKRIVWDGNESVWLAVGRSVLGMDVNGGRIGEIVVGEAVRALALGANGRIWVGLRDRVEVWDRHGKRHARWAAFGGKPFVTGLAWSPDGVYVADSGNRVVYRCGSEGEIQVRLGEKNTDRGIPGLVLPSPYLDVEIGRDGLLRVNNPGRHRIEIYTRNGDLEAGWGRAGVSLDGFCGCCNPVALALLEDGRVVVAEKGLPRVKVYSATGTLETMVAGPVSFAPLGSDERKSSEKDSLLEGLDVAVSPDGRVAVLDVPGGAVQIFREKTKSGRGA